MRSLNPISALVISHLGEELKGTSVTTKDDNVQGYVNVTHPKELLKGVQGDGAGPMVVFSVPLDAHNKVSHRSVEAAGASGVKFIRLEIRDEIYNLAYTMAPRPDASDIGSESENEFNDNVEHANDYD
ncbi:hypothetical protein Scep_021939 [Stephania cephalantha]|uniref:Uncharacterized protein n=1 Tax=Stephania cephalantha TaxID=152367 RepID=A0AAP0F6Z3_9MAGN